MTRRSAIQRAIARQSAPEPVAVTPAPTVEPEQDQSAAIISQLRDENLNLRIDNRGKEQAINFLMTQVREKDQHLQDVSYRLGAAETRLAQLDGPKVHDDAPRHSAPEDATEPVDAIVLPTPTYSEPPPAPTPEPPLPEPRRSVFGRLFQ